MQAVCGVSSPKVVRRTVTTTPKRVISRETDTIAATTAPSWITDSVGEAATRANSFRMAAIDAVLVSFPEPLQ